MLTALCIINKHSDILFFKKFHHAIEKSIFQDFIKELNTCFHGEPPPIIESNGTKYVSIFRHDLYWVGIVAKGSMTERCGDMFLVEALVQFSAACLSLIGPLTQHSIEANTVLIHEVLLESMPSGYIQMMDADKIKPHLYSKVISAQESSSININTGLFGLERTAPSSASRKSVLMTSTSKREVFVDIVEQIRASVTADGRILSSEVRGEVILNCLLAESPSIHIQFNTDLCPKLSQGFESCVRLTNVEFNSDVKIIEGKNTTNEMRVNPSPGENVIMTYSLPTTPHLLPFTINCTTNKLTDSDAELRLKITSVTPVGSIAPNVKLKVDLPPHTTSVMSRTTGPKQQEIHFNSSDTKLTWTISNFAGGGMAQATIRLIDSGGIAKVESGILEFEVSHWACSGVKVENVKLIPVIENVKKWVRCLTSSDGVTLNF